METEHKGYYDIEIDCEGALTQSGMIDQVFYLQDLKQRKLYLDDEVTQITVPEIVRHILQINREDYGKPEAERQPILLYVTSIGGDVDFGFELIDAIQCNKTPVYTVNLGFQYSMGFLIGLAGHRRYATRNAKFLMHDGSSFIYNSGAKAQDQMEFNKKVEERVKQYILSRTSISSEQYDSKLRVEWYMFADEAKENGITDFIIGEDCDLDAVV